MSTFRWRQSSKAVAAGAVLVAVLMIVQAMGMHEQTASAGKRIRVGKGRAIQLTLHGSTPSMAWSPDSKRVAVNAAFEYYGYRRQLQKYRKHLGVYVLDVVRRKTLRVTKNQGYHPLWLSNTRVAWGHSPYESGSPGLFVATVKKSAGRIKRLGSHRGVYNTQRAKNGRILFYSGFPEYKRWVYANARTGAIQATGKGGTSSGAGWTPPPTLWKKQCLQTVGKTVASVNSTSTAYQLKTAKKSVLLTGKPYTYKSAGAMGCGTSGTCAAVLPCLSPNGKWIAYFTQSAVRGVLKLNVKPIR